MLTLFFKNSSIAKKQIVALTGLALILFLIGHLAGNLFIYAGPEAFNGYAKKLAGLRPFLYVIEWGLLIIFLTHIFYTALLVLENIKARGRGYAVSNSRGPRSWATRLMPYTGILILIFVVYHLLDFTFIDHTGPRSILPNGMPAGLYGVVYNAFLNPLHSGFYILAMGAVGFHLVHAIESFFQTFGLNHPRYTPRIKKASLILGSAIALGFSSIPVFVMINFWLPKGIGACLFH